MFWLIVKQTEAKRQVLANICSFAYNPINFEALNRLNIIPTLLDSLQLKDDKLKEFAISGLCNLSAGICITYLIKFICITEFKLCLIFLDPNNMHTIITNNGLNKIHKCLAQNLSNEQIIISTLTLLIYSKDLNNQVSGKNFID